MMRALSEIFGIALVLLCIAGLLSAGCIYVVITTLRFLQGG